MNIHQAALAVPTPTAATILTVWVEDFTEAAFTISNQSGVALNAFGIYAKMSDIGPEIPLASLAGDFSTPVWPVRRASALVTLAGANVGFIFLNVGGIHSIMFKAGAAAANCVLIIDGQAT